MTVNPFTLKQGFIPKLTASNIVNISTKQNNFVKSGILTNNSDLGNMTLTSPGDVITVPFTNDLDGDVQAWDDETDINSSGLTTGYQRIFKFAQAQAFSYTDKAQIFTVSNPQEVIQNRFGNWWTRVDQKLLLAVLTGVFNNKDIANAKSYTEPNGGKFNSRGFLATINKFGDLQDNSLSKIVVNSATYAEMKSQNLLDNPGNATPQAQVVNPFGTYNGMSIVLDDDLPVAPDGTTTSYVFGDGAVSYSVALPSDAVEVQRDALAQGGRSTVINRRIVSCHVNGTSVAKNFAPKGQTVTPDELAQGSTWEVNRDYRYIKVVAYTAKVSDDFNPNAPAGGNAKKS